MRCFLITCNGYRAVREVSVSSYSELPALCREAEQETNDGYAVFASHNGRHVADVDGLIVPWEPDPIYQAGLMAACGYHD